MSEHEILKRQQYKKNRKKWTFIQLVAIIAVAAVAFVSFLVYNQLDRTYYIEYTEGAEIDYRVQYKENEFFDEEWLGMNQSYISSLVNSMSAEFDYKLQADAQDMGFDYKYKINAVLDISNKNSGAPYYTSTDVILSEKGGIVQNGSAVAIKETVGIDFVKYDELARSFVDVYDLKNTASCTLAVVMDVEIVSSNRISSEKSNNSYTATLNIPLATDTFDIFTTSSSPANEIKSLEYKSVAERAFYLVLSTSAAVLMLLLTVVLLAFLHLTKNEDITYSAKVRKILRSYGSFIQRMEGEFDCEDYQVINIKTFVEMLGIRDTIQSPVLMSENKDETMTRFFVPTATKLLYVFEVKVDNYDEIYGKNNDTNPDGTPPKDPAPETDGGDGGASEELDAQLPEFAEEEAVEIVEELHVSEPEAEPVSELYEEDVEQAFETVEASEEIASAEQKIDAAEENAQTPEPEEDKTTENAAIDAPVFIPVNIIEITPDDESGDESADVLAYVDEAGNEVRITCARSFTANLIQSNAQIKEYYNEIKNYILSFKAVKARSSWRCETYKKGRIQLFKLKIRGKTICLYCALDPIDYDSSKYFQEATDAKMFAGVPMMVRIKSDRGLKRAKTLVDDVMARFSIPADEKAATVDYVKDYPYDTTRNLVERKLIRLLLPDAVAAEPKPHHHVHKKTVEVVHDDVVEEIVVFDSEAVDDVIIEQIATEPTPELEEIDYDDASEEVAEFVETEDCHGVDVIGVVWPERPKRNKIYRYDPAGETVNAGDVVIVPTRDESRQRDVIRKAAVAHSNHKVDPDEIKYPLKKIVGVLHKKTLGEDEALKK